MSNEIYLLIMLGIMGVVSVVVLPALLTKKCPGCMARNGLDAKCCKKCGREFIERDDD